MEKEISIEKKGLVLECICDTILDNKDIIRIQEGDIKSIENMNLDEKIFKNIDFIFYNEKLKCFIPCIVCFNDFNVNVLNKMDEYLEVFEESKKIAIGMVIFINEYIDIIEYTLNKDISKEYIDLYNEWEIDRNKIKSNIYNIFNR